MKFTIVFPDGAAINEKTIIRSNGAVKQMKTPCDICRLIKNDFLKRNSVNSFTQWAEELNQDKNFDGGFTKYDALDNLASTYTLNIDGQHLNLYKYFEEYFPFKN